MKRMHFQAILVVALICCFGVLGVAQAQNGEAERGVPMPVSPWVVAAMGIALAGAGAFMLWRHRRASVR